MKYLLFAGAPNTGKTESILQLAKILRDNLNYKEIYKVIPEKGDFQCILRKGNKKVLIQSDTDTLACIKKLKNFYSENTDVDVVITSIRDIVDPMRWPFEIKMDLSNDDFIVEIPLGKVRRGQNRDRCKAWYLDNVQKLTLKVIKSEPFNF